MKAEIGVVEDLAHDADAPDLLLGDRVLLGESAGTYPDSSAIVKLAVSEPESLALRRYLRTRRPLVSNALARTEVLRALLAAGDEAMRRGHDVPRRLDLIRLNDRILNAAGRSCCLSSFARWTRFISPRRSSSALM